MQVRRIGRWLALAAAVIVLVPAMADARAGAGSSAGSRGSRTNQAPPPTQTAPTAKPVERSVTPQAPAQQPSMAAAPATARPGFFARNPFLSGLMGGIVGAGLFGMLFGGGFGGAAGMGGLLVQLLLIGGLGYLAVRLFRGWSARNAAVGPSSYAYAAPAALPEQPAPRASGALLGGAPLLMGNASTQLAIAEGDYNAFESLLADVQSAYSTGNLAKMRELATPEMVGYFGEELAANASRGVENKVEQVKLEQGDLAEAWSEAGIDYATVAMRFSMLDVTRRLADGTIVEGNDGVRTQATEIWTFLRSRGGKWILSAIQQS